MTTTTTATEPRPLAASNGSDDRPYRGRRISWAEFERITGKKRPEAANDNRSKQPRSAACAIKPPVPVAIFAIPVPKISDEQPAERAGSSTDKGSFAALYYSADEGASSCSDADVTFRGGASGQGRCENQGDKYLV